MALFARPAGLVIFAIFIYGPNVVFFLASKDVAGCQHGRDHRVILIVVFVHSIAANQMEMFGYHRSPKTTYYLCWT